MMKNLTKIIVSIAFFLTTLSSTSYLEGSARRKSEKNISQKSTSQTNKQLYAIDTGGTSFVKTKPKETRYYMATAFALAALTLIIGLAYHNRGYHTSHSHHHTDSVNDPT